MASSSPIRFLLIALLSFLIVGVAARPGVHFHPCKILYVAYSLKPTGLPEFSSDRNPRTYPSRFFAVFRIVRPVRFYGPDTSSSASIPLNLHRPLRVQQDLSSSTPSASLPYFGSSNSLRERAKDILVVVMGLLFGVGCGALTAATMYLVWSLLTNRYEVCGYRYDDGEEEDESESQKKMGYVSIPPVPATPVSPVKEGYEGN